MRKIVLSVVLLSAAAASFSFAENYRDYKRMCVSANINYRNIGKDMIGFEINSGYYPSKNILITGEFNMGFSGSDTLGHFKYGHFPLYDQHTGDINYSYTAYEILFSFQHVSSLSKKFRLRAGPISGLSIMKGENSFDPDKDKVNGLPDTESTVETAFAGGLALGLIWNITESFFLDLGYKFLYNSGLNFKEDTIEAGGINYIVKEKNFSKTEHSIGLSAGYRFL